MRPLPGPDVTPADALSPPDPRMGRRLLARLSQSRLMQVAVGTNEGRNVAWLALERILRMGASAIVGAVVARHLGATAYGSLVYAMAFATVLSPFVSAGDSLVVRDLAAGEVPAGMVLANAVVLAGSATTIGLVLLVCVVVALPGFMPPGTRLLVFVVLAGTALQPLSAVNYWFQARLQARRATMARNGALVAGIAGRLTAVVLGLKVLAFAIITSAEVGLATVLLLVAYLRSGESFRSWRMHRAHLSRLARQAAPLVAAAVSVVVYLRVDQVMLGSLSNVRANAMYGIAVNLSEISLFLPVAIGTVVTPSMTRWFQRDKVVYYDRLQKLFTAAMLASYVVILGGLAVAPWFIPLLYGDQYRDAVPAFLVLSLSIPFVFLGVVQSIWIIHENKQRFALYRTAVAAVINVGLNFLLLPRFGAVGASFTSVFSYFIAGMAANLSFRTTRPILYMQLKAMRLAGLRALIRDPRALTT